MVRQANVMRWVTLVFCCVFLTAVGLGIVAMEPVWRVVLASRIPGIATFRSRDEAATVLPAPPSQGPVPIAMNFPQRNHAPVEPYGHSGRCDNIVVEVNQDGSLRVLGEPMPIQAFRELLSAQMREQLRTLVTIRPDGQCPFRHVGTVISVCQDVGVPHQTQAGQISASTGTPADGPA